MKQLNAILECAIAASFGSLVLNAQVPALDFVRSGQLQTIAGRNLSPTDLISDPNIIFEDGRYRMWYTTVAYAYTSQQVLGIGYAESADGTTWVPQEDPDTGEPTLVVQPTPGGWDSAGVETPSVTRSPSGKYLLYYSGDQSASNHYWAIGLAESDDGYTWTKVGSTPVFTGSEGWDGPFWNETAWVGGVGEPSVNYDPVEGIFKIWYSGFGFGGPYPSYSIGYATSTDGIVWTRHPTPVLTPGLPGAWDDGLVSQPHVVYDPIAAAYHMFYFGASSTDIITSEASGASSISGAIGFAYSNDGISWQKRADEALIKLGTGWEGWTIGAPAGLIEANTIKLWYHGFNFKDSFASGLGLATAQIPR